MHGELLKARCVRCRQIQVAAGDLTIDTLCPKCGGKLRPHIVWFGEMPLFLEEEIPTALRAEIFACIGSSSVVYPAAGFVLEAKAHGAFTIEVNPESTAASGAFDLVLRGPATREVPQLVRGLLALDSTG